MITTSMVLNVFAGPGVVAAAAGNPHAGAVRAAAGAGFPMARPRMLSAFRPGPERGSRVPGFDGAWLTDPVASGNRAFVSFSWGYSPLGPGIYEYPEYNRANAGPMCMSPTLQFVNGIGVDGGGNLWVPAGGLGAVYEMQSDCAFINSGALNDPVGQPDDVAFDVHGHAYVSNIQTFYNSSPGPGNVLQYTNGKVSANLNYAGFGAVIGVAVDAHGNPWASYQGNPSGVVEFPHAKEPAVPAAGIVLGSPGGLQFDMAGNLLVIDQYARKLLIYAPPFSHGPSFTLALANAAAYCALNRAETRLSCAAPTVAQVDVYSYPAPSYLYSYHNGLMSNMVGIAVSPAAPN